MKKKRAGSVSRWQATYNRGGGGKTKQTMQFHLVPRRVAETEGEIIMRKACPQRSGRLRNMRSQIVTEKSNERRNKTAPMGAQERNRATTSVHCLLPKTPAAEPTAEVNLLRHSSLRLRRRHSASQLERRPTLTQSPKKQTLATC